MSYAGPVTEGPPERVDSTSVLRGVDGGAMAGKYRCRDCGEAYERRDDLSRAGRLCLLCSSARIVREVLDRVDPDNRREQMRRAKISQNNGRAGGRKPRRAAIEPLPPSRG